MGKTRMSLVEYQTTQRSSGSVCWLCSIPERQEVEDAVLRKGVTKMAAMRWLRDVCHYEQATPNRIGNHFSNHVRET